MKRLINNDVSLAINLPPRISLDESNSNSPKQKFWSGQEIYWPYQRGSLCSKLQQFFLVEVGTIFATVYTLRGFHCETIILIRLLAN